MATAIETSFLNKANTKELCTCSYSNTSRDRDEGSYC